MLMNETLQIITDVIRLGDDSDDHYACQTLDSADCDSMPNISKRY